MAYNPNLCFPSSPLWLAVSPYLTHLCTYLILGICIHFILYRLFCKEKVVPVLYSFFILSITGCIILTYDNVLLFSTTILGYALSDLHTRMGKTYQYRIIIVPCVVGIVLLCFSIANTAYPEVMAYKCRNLEQDSDYRI
jgi:hypothetical protein